MNKYIIGSIAAVSLTLSACGGGDDPQGEVADMTIDLIKAAAEIEGGDGIAVDESCVKEAAEKLSDADAQAIVDAGPDGTPDVSAEGQALADAMFESCITFDE